ncbi:MAG: hypothetical protein K9I94_10860 [Bacteroidales bacterium]|nr:hypothetical protein [Bacteroidales bacterium]
METRLARIISYIFHPLLMPTYGLFIMFNLKAYFAMAIPEQAKWMIIGLVFITTFLIPLLLVMLMVRRGMISSLFVDNKTERFYPFTVIAIFYLLAFYMFRQLELAPFFQMFLFGALVLVIMAMAINFYWKISLHMTAVGGLLGVFLALTFRLMIDLSMYLFITILIGGLIGFARLKLKSHDSKQVYTGFVMGGVVMFSIFYFI